MVGRYGMGWNFWGDSFVDTRKGITCTGGGWGRLIGPGFYLDVVIVKSF